MTTLFALCLTLFTPQPAMAADADSPHPHQGVAVKFASPAPTPLSEAEEIQLAAGEAVRKQVRSATGGRGIAIMDVHASVDRIWAVIQDFGSYPNWIDNLKSTSVYGNQAGHILVEFQLSVMGMGVTYYIDHSVYKDKGYMTWQLDYTRESDIDDSTGYWLTYPVPGKPGFTRVEYTVDLRLKGWVPGIVENMLAKKGLVLATSWVKQQSE
jgi:uncharacterized membrane protein